MAEEDKETAAAPRSEDGSADEESGGVASTGVEPPAPDATPACQPPPPAPQTPLTPRTPCSPRRQPPSVNRTLSFDPGVRGTSAMDFEDSSSLKSLSLRQRLLVRMRAPSACLKIAQLVLSVLCLGLVADGYLLVVSQNVTAMHFPFIVFSSYTIITGVILFGYVTGMKMRELLMRIFGAMGGLLFLISSITTAHRAFVFWQHWQDMYEEGPTEELFFDSETIPRRRACFVAQTLLAFAAAALHIADVTLSLRRTLHHLQ